MDLEISEVKRPQPQPQPPSDTKSSSLPGLADTAESESQPQPPNLLFHIFSASSNKHVFGNVLTCLTFLDLISLELVCHRMQFNCTVAATRSYERGSDRDAERRNRLIQVIRNSKWLRLNLCPPWLDGILCGSSTSQIGFPCDNFQNRDMACTWFRAATIFLAREKSKTTEPFNVSSFPKEHDLIMLQQFTAKQQLKQVTIMKKRNIPSAEVHRVIKMGCWNNSFRREFAKKKDGAFTVIAEFMPDIGQDPFLISLNNAPVLLKILREFNQYLCRICMAVLKDKTRATETAGLERIYINYCNLCDMTQLANASSADFLFAVASLHRDVVCRIGTDSSIAAAFICLNQSEFADFQHLGHEFVALGQGKLLETPLGNRPRTWSELAELYRSDALWVLSSKHTKNTLTEFIASRVLGCKDRVLEAPINPTTLLSAAVNDSRIRDILTAIIQDERFDTASNKKILDRLSEKIQFPHAHTWREICGEKYAKLWVTTTHSLPALMEARNRYSDLEQIIAMIVGETEEHQKPDAVFLNWVAEAYAQCVTGDGAMNSTSVLPPSQGSHQEKDDGKKARSGVTEDGVGYLGYLPKHFTLPNYLSMLAIFKEPIMLLAARFVERWPADMTRRITNKVTKLKANRQNLLNARQAEKEKMLKMQQERRMKLEAGSTSFTTRRRAVDDPWGSFSSQWDL